MAISKTDILNKSLTLIGANPVVNIDDASTNAKILNRVYELSLRSILSQCKWNFATKRLLLTQSSDELDWYDTGETYIYSKPTDIIRIFGVSVPKAKWREEGDYIISDTQGLGIRYVQYLDNPSKYSSTFVEAFNDKLCSDIAYIVVNSSTLGDKFKIAYEKISLPDAMADNAQVGTQQILEDDAWELAKYNNSQPDS